MLINLQREKEKKKKVQKKGKTELLLIFKASFTNNINLYRPADNAITRSFGYHTN